MNNLKNILSIVLIVLAVNSFGQTPSKSKHLPIIDVHVHTMKVNPANLREMCPWFLTSMPGGDPNEKMTFKPGEGCANPLQPARSDAEMQAAVMETMERLNMTLVAFSDAEILHRWYNAAPKGRIIPGIGIGSGMTVQAFKDSLSNGFYKVMSEVAPQYQGISPSDMSLDAYFAVAEELNMPVGIHMGTGGNGMANITRPTFRASLGNPLILEDLLARHPKLKIWVQHAGYPMIDELIALMGANAYVYCDISGMIWSYPLDEVNVYIKRIVQAGFGKRIMYGTDFMSWPKLFETSIGVIENAQYLSFDQKRDILFNNAVRFFRLDPTQFQ
jgi:hypothetical protein